MISIIREHSTNLAALQVCVPMSSRPTPRFKRQTRQQIVAASGEETIDFRRLPPPLRRAFQVSPALPEGTYKRMPMPRAGDWLAHHEERGQTFRSFERRAVAHAPHGHCTVLEVVPVGVFDPLLSPPLDELGAFMTAFFGVRCRVAPPVALRKVATSGLVRDDDDDDGEGEGGQLLTGDAMDFLRKRRVGRDVFAQIAVTMVDVTPGEGWNFVYGQVRSEER